MLTYFTRKQNKDKHYTKEMCRAAAYFKMNNTPKCISYFIFLVYCKMKCFSSFHWALVERKQNNNNNHFCKALFCTLLPDRASIGNLAKSGLAVWPGNKTKPRWGHPLVWSLRAAQYEVVPKKCRVLVLHGLTARSKHSQSSLQDKKAPISCAQTPM